MENRSELETKVFQLTALGRTGKIQFSYESRQIVKNLNKMRYLPNGRVDLQMIDSPIRATMNGLLHLAEQSDLLSNHV